jgi:hypothetical protein
MLLKFMRVGWVFQALFFLYKMASGHDKNKESCDARTNNLIRFTRLQAVSQSVLQPARISSDFFITLSF